MIYTATGATQGAQWPVFGPGVHYVAWQATDASRNSSAVKDQLVNIKAPGTNLPAVAFDRRGADAVQAIADVPITVTVRGADGNTPKDPIWFTVDRQPDEPVVDVRTYTLWNEINDIYVASEDRWRGPEYRNARSAAWDTANNVLYVIGAHNLTGMAAFRPAECNNTTSKGPDDCLDLLGTPVYSSSIVQTTKTGNYGGFGAETMRLWGIKDVTVDSAGAVYIAADPTTSATRYHRIYKFAPATTDPDGSVALGELIGWMGKCSSGANCNYIQGHSIGFSCTDDTCAVEGDLSGNGPGQFSGIAAIAMDPKDVLYVADSGNERVQRFNSDGIFAGEARSVASCPGCSGFVLGDFGRPGNIAVNSSNFYILDIDSELVHVFEASVIHSIDDTSAWVAYQSDSNYVGPDSFTFRATDGFRTAHDDLFQSEPATVELSVARNFRPPQASAGLAISTTEDTPVSFTLNGYDLDGDLDTLTYRVVAQPGYGKISGVGAERIYTPDADFHGDDSFTFVVNDGREDSASMLVPISAAPANDPPTVTLRTQPLTAGVGFPFSLDAVIVDQDHDDTHSLTVVWGDGQTEGAGQIRADGTLSAPIILADTTITSTVLGYHTYTDPGEMALTLCATDAAGSQGCITHTVVVTDQVDLALGREGAAVVGANTRTLTYALSVENRVPNSGGLAAEDVVLRETLARGATYQRVDVNGPFTCTAGGRTLHCPIGGLAVGSWAQVIITVALDEKVAVGKEIAAESRVTSSTPDAIPDNNTLLVDLALLPAADFYVTSLADGDDLTPGDGICSAAGGCTLRAAVQEANALPGAQTISLGYGVHQLNIAPGDRLAAGSDALPGGALLVADQLTLVGLSPDRTIINANGLSRVFDLNGASLTLRDLMLSGGAASEGGGGAILAAEGDLRLEQVALAGNQAADGGGLLARASSVWVSESAFTDNRTLPGGSGGAIYNDGGSITVQNSTFSGNRAARGGALMHAAGDFSVENATIVDNDASEEGGGISSTANGVTLDNTILAGNSAPLGPACLGRFTSSGHNLLDDLQDCTVLGQTTTNVLAAGREWEGLSRTSADTYAHPLPGNGGAVDAGSCQLATDQRGGVRPFGGGCDIGAMEYNPWAGATSLLYVPIYVR